MKKVYIILLVLIALFLIGLFGYMAYLDNPQPLPRQNTQQPPVTDVTAGWNMVKNDQYGFEFKYPADFGSKYASLQSVPAAIVTSQGNANIDSNGCYTNTVGGPTKDSQITINGMQFCLSTASDPGAGQLYNTSNYTTLHNGNYVTLQYVVHTLNGCSPYMGTPDFQPCTDFMNNYASMVTKTIEKSVATLQFTQ